MNITYFMQDRGGCTWVRSILPMTKIHQNKAAKVLRVQKGDNANKIIEACSDADIIQVARVCDDVFVAFLTEMQKQGKKIVLDFDDNMFRISPLSPHYADFGTVYFKFSVPGTNEHMDVWNENNLDIERNRKRLESIKRVCEVVDMVTVTTEQLAEVYREFNPNVRVLPNCIDLKLWEKVPLKENGDIKLFWSGGASHYEDWFNLVNVLPEIMNKYDRVKLILLGAMFEGTVKGIPKDRLTYHNWVDTYAYPYFVRILNPTIGIIPLSNTYFNSCKSPNKWLEYGALNMPSVTSYVKPYSDIATEKNGIWIEGNDTEGWVKGLSHLIEDCMNGHKEHSRYSEEAYRTVDDNFNIDKEYIRWMGAYKELV